MSLNYRVTTSSTISDILYCQVKGKSVPESYFFNEKVSEHADIHRHILNCLDDNYKKQCLESLE